MALLGGVCARARSVCFGFLLCRVALCIGLVLLGLAFTDYVVTTDDRARDLFGLTLDAFDGAFDALFGSAVVIAY